MFYGHWNLERKLRTWEQSCKKTLGQEVYIVEA